MHFEGSFRVPGSADKVIRRFAEVALVCSDTQGFETQIVASGSSLWAAGTPLWVEVWPQGLACHGGVQQFLVAVGLQRLQLALRHLQGGRQRGDMQTLGLTGLAQQGAGRAGHRSGFSRRSRRAISRSSKPVPTLPAQRRTPFSCTPRTSAPNPSERRPCPFV